MLPLWLLRPTLLDYPPLWLDSLRSETRLPPNRNVPMADNSLRPVDELEQTILERGQTVWTGRLGKLTPELADTHLGV